MSLILHQMTLTLIWRFAAAVLMHLFNKTFFLFFCMGFPLLLQILHARPMTCRLGKGQCKT